MATIVRVTPAKASTDVHYRFMLGGVPFIGTFLKSAVVATTADTWLETFLRTRTVFAIVLDAGATFSGRFQGTLDGITWFDLVPETGSTTTANPITQANAPGFWIFSGAWQYLRFNPTAQGVAAINITHSTVRF